MEIRARCRFDYESVKALSHISLYKRKNPRRAFLLMLVLCLFLLGMSVFAVNSLRLSLIVCALIIWNLYMYFIFPRMQFRALKKLQYLENEYVFTEESIRVRTKGEEYNGEAEIKYSMIPKAMENSGYFMIFQSGNAAYIVDKATLSGGTAEQIREKLKAHVGKKYVLSRS